MIILFRFDSHMPQVFMTLLPEYLLIRQHVCFCSRHFIHICSADHYFISFQFAHVTGMMTLLYEYAAPKMQKKGTKLTKLC